MGTKVYDNALDLITFTRASGGTYLDSDGLLKTASNNIPRIEYAADGTVKGLLIEEQRTNLVTYSEDFTDASWSKSNTGTLAVDATGPDGQTSAVTLVDSGATGAGAVFVVDAVSVSTSSPYTFSAYLKADQLNWARLTAEAFTTPSAGGAYFDLSTGQVGTVSAGFSATIQDVGDGWYRCSITFTTDVSDTAGNVVIYAADANNDNLVDLDGTSSILIYGAQLEAGSFPTSYIPTSGSTVTRAADIAFIPVSAFGYNQKAGSVVVDCLSNSGEFGERAISLSDGTSTNQSWLQISGGGSFVGNVYTSGAYVAQLDNTTSTAGGFTAALAFKNNSFGLSVNGGSAVSDTAGNIAVYSDLHIGRRHDGLSSTVFNGHIKSIAYYPRRLTNTQLQELTA